MQNIIIAFSGKAQAGKTQSSEILKELVESGNDLTFQKLSFATAVKEIAKYYFNWDGDKGIYHHPKKLALLDSPEMEDSNTIIQDKGRQLLINIGSNFREIRPTIWADIIMKTMADLDVGKPENVIYCIDDLRFLNEINVLNTYGRTEFVRVKRPSQLDLDDPTERDLDAYKFERHIENDGTLDELKKQVNVIYQDILKKYN